MGSDVRDLPNAGLRRQVAVALQETVLFSGTIRDNIRYGRPEASEAEVVAAAQAAQADEFIRGLPEGYDTAAGAARGQPVGRAKAARGDCARAAAEPGGAGVG